jgi:GntR family transcriptional regulator/MocR family aminotransferase
MLVTFALLLWVGDLSSAPRGSRYDWHASTSNFLSKTHTNRVEFDGFPADLLLVFDRSRPRGLRAQLESGLRNAIQQGRLLVGSTLPASRTLARELGLARTVVVEA